MPQIFQRRKRLFGAQSLESPLSIELYLTFQELRPIAEAYAQALNTEFPKEVIMLKWAFIFLVIALIAAALGFTGLAGAAATIAKILFGIFLLICLVLFALAISVTR